MITNKADIQLSETAIAEGAAWAREQFIAGRAPRERSLRAFAEHTIIRFIDEGAEINSWGDALNHCEDYVQESFNDYFLD